MDRALELQEVDTPTVSRQSARAALKTAVKSPPQQKTGETKTADIAYQFRKGSTGLCRKKSYIDLVNPFARP